MTPTSGDSSQSHRSGLVEPAWTRPVTGSFEAGTATAPLAPSPWSQPMIYEVWDVDGIWVVILDIFQVFFAGTTDEVKWISFSISGSVHIEHVVFAGGI